jgi:hypothetical protein
MPNQTGPKNGLSEFTLNEFWSGELGLTLISISLIVLIFVITPLREAGTPGRVIFDVFILGLMVSGAITVDQTRFARVSVVAFLLVTAMFLGYARIHPRPWLNEVGSICVTITLMLYFRIVMLVLFRKGPITWSRIQGGICAYLLLGMAWASAYQFLEQAWPGSFQFVTSPRDMDQLTAKLTYFSFSTLTTVGGQIVAASPIARSLSIAEATVGQLFPAILISTLVAMALGSQPKS